MIRVLEESAQSEGGGRVVTNGSAGGVSLGELTFQELVKKLVTLLAGSAVDPALCGAAVQQAMQLGYKISEGFEGGARAEIINVCNELDRVAHQQGGSMGDGRARQEVAAAVRRLEAAVNEVKCMHITMLNQNEVRKVDMLNKKFYPGGFVGSWPSLGPSFGHIAERRGWVGAMQRAMH